MKLIIYVNTAPRLSKNEWSYASNPTYAFMAFMGAALFSIEYFVVSDKK
jgi:hypothetical protein